MDVLKRLLLSCLLLYLAPAMAEHSQRDIQKISDLQDIAVKHVRNTLGTYNYGRVAVEAGRLDPRLRLNYCHPKLLHAYFPPGTKALNAKLVGIRCESATPWAIYVPVKVQIFSKVFVTNQNIAKGAILSPNNIRAEETDVTRIRSDYFTAANQLIGHVITRNLAAGQIISKRDLGIAKIVKRGDLIIITAHSDSIKVISKGEAMTDGGLDETIKIKTLDGQRVISATITGKNKAEVEL